MRKFVHLHLRNKDKRMRIIHQGGSSGFLTPSGDIFEQVEEYRVYLGHVNKELGHVSEDGVLRNAEGEVVAFGLTNGILCDARREPIGRVDKDGIVWVGTVEIGHLEATEPVSSSSPSHDDPLPNHDDFSSGALGLLLLAPLTRQPLPPWDSRLITSVSLIVFCFFYYFVDYATWLILTFLAVFFGMCIGSLVARGLTPKEVDDLQPHRCFTRRNVRIAGVAPKSRPKYLKWYPHTLFVLVPCLLFLTFGSLRNLLLSTSTSGSTSGQGGSNGSASGQYLSILGGSGWFFPLVLTLLYVLLSWFCLEWQFDRSALARKRLTPQDHPYNSSGQPYTGLPEQALPSSDISLPWERMLQGGLGLAVLATALCALFPFCKAPLMTAAYASKIVPRPTPTPAPTPTPKPTPTPDPKVVRQQMAQEQQRQAQQQQQQRANEQNVALSRIEAKYRASEQAFTQHDAEGAMSYADTNWYYQGKDGAIESRSQSVASFNSLFNEGHDKEYTTAIRRQVVKVLDYSGTRMTLSLDVFAEKSTGRTLKYRQRDTWSRQGTEWLCISEKR
jgi:hypothetical protein